MNTLAGSFGPDMIQRRGGLLPGSPPQSTCDVCSAPVDPATTTEVTISTPSTCTRLVAHARCAPGLRATAAVLILPVAP